MTRAIRLSNLQATVLKSILEGHGGQLTLSGGREIFQTTLGSLIQRKLVAYKNGYFVATDTGAAVYWEFLKAPIYRKTIENWGAKVLLVLPKTQANKAA